MFRLTSRISQKKSLLCMRTKLSSHVRRLTTIDSEHYESHPFLKRHIGPTFNDQIKMLNELGFKTMEEFMSNVIPPEIKITTPLNVPEAMGQAEMLSLLEKMMAKNKTYRSYIGLGFYSTLVPPPILRNVFENPGWYTSYTPYQPEIAQGRLEALFNYQTMITDITKLSISNASLLDEATAATEVLFLALRKTKKQKILVHKNSHITTIASLKSRAKPLNVDVDQAGSEDIIGKLENCEDYGCVMVPYPDTFGNLASVDNLKELANLCAKKNVLFCVMSDLMALTKITPPGEFGADICIGSAQRFGVPVGFGGPAAAFLSVKKDLLRYTPGRIIGSTKDRNGNPALRLTLQTREQHIKRDKANSNICTSQALLANMSSFYAIYHGPKGLKAIADGIHEKTLRLAASIRPVFDTIHIKPSEEVEQIRGKALAKEINLRYNDDGSVCISLDETVGEDDLRDLSDIFNVDLVTKSSLSSSMTTKELQIPEGMQRKSKFLTQKIFNSLHDETKIVRYMKVLENKDISLVHSAIPLGSCTMKLNAAVEMIPCSWKSINSIHPFVPRDQVQGYLEMLTELERYLEDITGYDKVCLAPNSGAQGEYAGLRAISEYQASIGQEQRKICLIPLTAHGTNPASAVLAGFSVKPVRTTAVGAIDMGHLTDVIKEYREQLGAIMITYPSTSGVFDKDVENLCDIIHDAGGQVYVDGANMNAMVGLCKPGQFKGDVSHLNLHKTFCIPHGGGGPGVGPVCVKKHLVPFLPNNILFNCTASGDFRNKSTENLAICNTPFGSASITPIPWMYIRLMGPDGLKRASEVAILSANYMMKRLKDSYTIKYTNDKGFCAHEFILDFGQFKKHCSVLDVAKRLMDFSFHSPTMSWPYPDGIMVEPTESEGLEECQRLIEAFTKIRKEIEEIIRGDIAYTDSPLSYAPHHMDDIIADSWSRKYSREIASRPGSWQGYTYNGAIVQKVWPGSARVDDSFGDRNVVCSCPPFEEDETEKQL